MKIQCPAFELPDSPLLSKESQASLQRRRDQMASMMEQAQQSPTNKDPRQNERDLFYNSEAYRYLREHYSVDIEETQIAGVLTEHFLPADGIAPNNKHRVLINLHGGGFECGSRTHSQLESIPVAALGNIRVVSVDYRMAPEYRFPAATDDVVAVYRALLQDYQPENIGFYGASSGAQLVTKTLVRLQEQELPLPAAVGMIAGGATRVVGDSVAMVNPILLATLGWDLHSHKRAYFEGADLKSPQVTPALSDAYMSACPPSLLISSTRDYLLSSVVATHRQLIRLGVEAELHLWEGLDHVFHYNPDLPETKELHELVVRFFDRHLGKSA